MDYVRITRDQRAGDAQEAPPGAGPARRVLMAFPRYAPSFGTMEHAFPVTGARAFMPPQGLLTLAGYLPEHWPVRFVDERRALLKEMPEPLSGEVNDRLE